MPQVFLQFSDLVPVIGQLDALFALEAARMDGHLPLVQIDGDGGRIGLDRDLLADGPRRDGIGIAVKAYGKVFVYRHLAGLPAIGQPLRQRA